MLDFHLPPVVAREEELCDPGTSMAVHHGYATPVSAHPDLVPPDGETGASGVLRPLGDANLILQVHIHTQHTQRRERSEQTLYWHTIPGHHGDQVLTTLRGDRNNDVGSTQGFIVLNSRVPSPSPQ